MVIGYMKHVKEKMKESGKSEEEIKQFEAGAQGYAKKIISNIKDYDFYVGESMDPDGM
jgi:Translationally controlled tumour protein